MKCDECGKEIPIGDGYYHAMDDDYCEMCVENDYTPDQISMMYAGLDIENKEDLMKFEELCAQYPKRIEQYSSDFFNFNLELDKLSDTNQSSFYWTENVGDDDDYICKEE